MNYLLSSGFNEGNFENGWFLTDIICSSLILGVLLLFVCLKVRKPFVWIFNCLIYALFLFALLCNIQTFKFLLIGFSLLSNYYFIRSNDGEFRKFIVKPLKSISKNSKDKTDDKTADRKKLISDLVIAVNWLSQNKVGALITFEKETPLDNYIKSGTIINCPFSPELVETIFYEGTRLHDGAIVIRNNTILAAAVYYQPSTKVVVGKFGARHRAALGISEVSDSITVVVSEETGRIAIAHNGMLDNVKADEFEKLISNQLL